MVCRDNGGYITQLKQQKVKSITCQHVHSLCGDAKVVVPRKRCKIETFLLQTSNRKFYMADQIAAVAKTLSDLHGQSPIASLFKCYFSYSCAWVDSSRGLSATAEF